MFIVPNVLSQRTSNFALHLIAFKDMLGEVRIHFNSGPFGIIFVNVIGPGGEP